MSGILGKTVRCVASAALAIALVPAVALTQPGGESQAQAAQTAVSVKAKAKSKSKKPAITVTRVNTGKLTLAKGSSYKLGAKASRGARLSYTSSKKRIAGVSKKGMLTAAKTGKTIVTVKAKAGKRVTTKKVKVTVIAKKKFKKVKSLKLKLGKQTLKAGESTRVKVTFSPKKASNKNVVYKSSKPSVATVSTSGKVTAKKDGSAKITAMSCDGGKKASARVKVLTKNGYDQNTGLYDPEKIDDDYKSEVKYRNDVKTVSSWSANANGTYTINDVPKGLVPGDDLVLEPTEEQPEGAVVRVSSVNSRKVVVPASDSPSLADLYDAIDVEGTSIASGSTFTPADGVKVESGGAKTSTGKWTAKTIRMKAVDANGDVGYGKFEVKVGDVSFTVKVGTDFKMKYSAATGLSEYYSVLKVDQSVASTIKASDLFGKKGKLDQKLGEANFATSMPGVFFRVAIWANVSADGKVTFSLENNLKLGVKYTKADGWGGVAKCATGTPRVEFEASLKTGIDATGSVNILAKPIADLSYGLNLNLKYDSKKEKHRDTGLICNNVPLNLGCSLEAGKHDSLLSDLGIGWSKDFKPIKLAKWHFEDLKYVSSCTYKEAGKDGRGENPQADNGNASDKDSETTERPLKLPKDTVAADGMSGTCGTCSWEIDGAGKLTIRPTNGKNGVLGDWTNGGNKNEEGPWCHGTEFGAHASDINECDDIITGVTVEPGVKALTCNGMFRYCAKLSSLNLSGLDTSSVRNMNEMFCDCRSIEKLDFVKGLVTSNVTTMEGIFMGCSKVSSVSLKGLDTSKVKDMSSCLAYCDGVIDVSLSGLDVSSVQRMDGMFRFDSKLERVNASNLDLSSLKDIEGAFYACRNLSSVDTSGCAVAALYNMNHAFDGCEKIKSVDLSVFDCSSVDEMDSVFADCMSLENLGSSDVDTSGAVSMNSMFLGCKSLSSLGNIVLETSNVEEMDCMFGGCSSLNLDCSDWNVDKVTSHERFGEGAPGVVPPAWVH